jgi:hypothetical protein
LGFTYFYGIKVWRFQGNSVRPYFWRILLA